VRNKIQAKVAVLRKPAKTFTVMGGITGKMKEVIAFCGVDCSEFPIYQATRNNDNDSRAKVAREYSERYKTEVNPQDINCDGCTSAGKKIMGYCQTCDIRKCGLDREVLNCGYCADYPCNKLDKVHTISAKAKANLEAFRNKK
jgi:hypothetical protein